MKKLLFTAASIVGTLIGILVPQMAMASSSLDLARSSIEIDFPTIESDGRDAAHVRVKLLSAAGKPMRGHTVQLISSRAKDQIVPLGENVSDPHGEVYFLVTSKEPGMSTLIAYDATENVTLSSRGRIAFVESAETFFGSGGDEVAYAAEAVFPAEKLVFEDIPTPVKKNTAVTFTVTAQDVNDQPAINFLGTIHFSAPGPTGIYVTLPEDYTFTEEDLGTHTFSLAMSFQKEGTYKIEVRDLKNPELFGSTVVTVTESGTPSSAVISGGVSLSSPIEGTYSTKTHTVSGIAVAGIDVKIFDNNQEIGKISADAEGKFTFTTPVLPDGVHAISAAMVDEFGTMSQKSNVVTITIDTTPPKVEVLEMIPAGAVKPKSTLEAKLFSEPKLVKVTLTVNNEVVPLTPDSSAPGVYSGKFLAPLTLGSYGVDAELQDELGNKQKYPALKTLEVSMQGASAATTLDVSPPSQVTGVQAFSESGRVTLVWDSAKDDTGIAKYRIYYGISSDKLTNILDTADHSTTWYIPNLQNNVPHFFGLTAIDTAGNESGAGSAVIGATPGTQKTSVFHPKIATSPKMIAETGPEMWILLLLTGIGSAIFFRFRKTM